MNRLARLLALAVSLATLAPAQPISPRLVGNNLWLAQAGNAASSPANSVMTLAGQTGLKLVRIGGSTFDYNPPSHADLLTWVDRIRAIGAEPIVQVSQYASAEDAAAVVAALNGPNRTPVRYWSIGNEPWLQAGYSFSELEMAARIEAYFKPRAAAMKEADPAIKIFGVNNEDFRNGLYTRLFGGSHNIAGLVPGRSYYYCDGITWHRYPRDLAPPADAAWQGLDDIRSRINQCVALVASANSLLGRGGDDALVWAIGEFNSRNGANVHTFNNGQMFAGVYGLAMRHGAFFASAWSLRESTTDPRGPDDFGLIEGTGNLLRPSYWHTQFVARHFTGRYAEGRPSVADAASPILVYGAVDDSLDRVSVMLLNRGDAPIDYTLHLNSINRHTASGRQALNVDAGRADTHSDTLAARSTQVLVFHRHTLTRIAYSAEDFAAATPRAPTTTRATRPLVAVVDDFATAGGLPATPYWSLQDVNGGASSLDSGALVLRAGSPANSTAAVAGPVTPEFNFFARGFTLALRGLAQTSANTAAAETSFRLALNSTSARAFRSPDSLALRLTPAEARLGFKIDQPDVQPELRAGASAAPALLTLVPLPGPVTDVHLSLDPDPAGPVDGLHTIRYTLRLDGAFGRLVRTGSFDAPRSAWGDSGDSALVLESRRDSGANGPVSAFVETRLDALTRQPVLLDDFTAAFTDQAWWSRLTSGAQSSATFTEGAAVLLARTAASASAQLNGPVSPEFNFFDRPLTLELRELDLAATDLAAGAAVFRFSLNSTTERSFVSPDALALRLTPDELQFGFKLDQASVNAEQRSGPPGSGSLLTLPLARPLTGLLLTLVPAPGAPPSATPVAYVLRLTDSAGESVHAGSFLADRTRWGAAGDSALMLEARRNDPASREGSQLRVSVGAVALRPAPDDLLDEAPRFAAWRQREFPAAALSDPALSGLSAAPAGDGVNNLLKYALGLPPLAPAAPGALPAAALQPDGSLLFTHSARLGSELAYVVQSSTDLVAWSPVPAASQTRQPAATPGWETVLTRVSPSADTPRVFMRLRVTAP